MVEQMNKHQAYKGANTQGIVVGQHVVEQKTILSNVEKLDSGECQRTQGKEFGLDRARRLNKEVGHLGLVVTGERSGEPQQVEEVAQVGGEG